MTFATFSLRVVLTDRELRAISRGAFVRVELGERVKVGVVEARSAIVGRPEGLWRAYANVCRHQAVPLDFGMGGERASPSTPAAVMADDGKNLICHQHGALYRPLDGACFSGPCAGESLCAFDIEEDGDALVLRA